MLTDGGGGTAQTVEMLIEEIRRIGTSTMEELKSNASSETQTFRNLTLPGSAFGEVPLGQQIARQHTAAHDVFVATIDGLISDLEDFQQKLILSANSHEQTDEAAREALLTLGRDYREHHYESNRNWEQSRTDHHDDLAVSEDGQSRDGGPEGHGSDDAGSDGPGFGDAGGSDGSGSQGESGNPDAGAPSRGY